MDTHLKKIWIHIPYILIFSVTRREIWIHIYFEIWIYILLDSSHSEVGYMPPSRESGWALTTSIYRVEQK